MAFRPINIPNTQPATTANPAPSSPTSNTPSQPATTGGFRPITVPGMDQPKNNTNPPGGTSTTTPPVIAQHPQAFSDIMKNLGGKIGNFIAPLGKDIGTAASVVDPETNKNRNSVINQSNTQVDNYIKLAKEATDPTKKSNYLHAAQAAALTSGDDIFNNPEYKKTAEQILGDGAQTALSVLSAGTIGEGAGAAAGAGKAVGIGKGIATGLAEGAKAGGAIGAIGGVDSGMQQGKNVLGVGESALTGAATGAAGGAALGAATGLAGGLIPSAEKATQRGIDALTMKAPDVSKAEYKELLAAGKIVPKSGLKPATIAVGDTEKELATKYPQFLSSKDPVVNANKAVKALDNSEKVAKKFIATNNKPIIEEDLANALYKQLGDAKDMNVQQKNVQDMVDKFIANLKEKSGDKPLDLQTLYDHKNDFTSDATYVGRETTQKNMDEAAKCGIQDYIKSITPKDEAGVEYQRIQDFQKDMFKLVHKKDGILVKKAAQEKGANWLKTFIDKHPAISWGGGFLGTAIGAGEAVNILKK